MLKTYRIIPLVFILFLFGFTLITVSPVFAQAPEANELRTGFADHTQTEEGTEQVQPRDQEVTKKRIINLKQERQNGKRNVK